MPESIGELSAVELSAAIRNKKISAREALADHLERIAAVNPVVNAVVTLDAESAQALAHRADQMTARGAELPPLHGVPMTHKDTNNTAGMRTTQGSLALHDFVPDADDLIIARLKAAGVVSTGKSNVPEFGAGSHTFNDLFGTTTNPYAPTLSAGGSSGGVAAVVASRVQSIGDGSDMGGSLRIPASFCNVVGFRPSTAVIPMPSDVNAYAWLGRTGPMARSVEDIALFMSVTAGKDSRVPHPAVLDPGVFRAGLEADMRGVRIGWSRDFGIGVPVDPEILEHLERQLKVFEGLGAIVEEATPDFSEADLVFGNTRAMDFAAGLGPILERAGDVIKPEVHWNVRKGFDLTARDLIETAAARTRLEQSVQSFFGQYHLFASPCAQVLPFDASQRYPADIAGVPSETYLDWMRSACLLSATGLPVLSVPAGFGPSGLPIGLQLATNHYTDMQLLRYGRAFEQQTGYAAVAPVVTPTREPLTTVNA
ncbi:amidase family protein [Paenarthrobacter nicotinovorans]|uniref:amidase family protein n=1 Tax=Paenarthrobacter nicotinovorans TaxID=29320 RepID=UPI00047A7C4A|nr:amidase family protein [Paenarthrobacter nicotinovorans]